MTTLSGPAGTLLFLPAAPEHEDTLFRIYASTRTQEMDMVPHWTAEQKLFFLKTQFDTQDRYYRAQFPESRFFLIQQGENFIGRLYLDHRPPMQHILDIALLPEYRGKGIGEFILRYLQEQARAAGEGVSIYVEKMNPALRLYLRLGFVVKDNTNEIYQYMEWNG